MQNEEKLLGMNSEFYIRYQSCDFLISWLASHSYDFKTHQEYLVRRTNFKICSSIGNWKSSCQVTLVYIKIMCRVANKLKHMVYYVIKNHH